MRNHFDKKYFYGKEKSNYGNYESINHSRQFGSVISFIREKGISGKFMDVGCAFGYLLKLASGYFDEVYGCDISPFAIGKAKKIAPDARLKVSDIGRSRPYGNAMFDCICALDLLEHTENMKKSFGTLARMLKKNGYLIISMPIDAWPRRIFGFLDKDPTHVSIIKFSELDSMLKKYGLEIVKRSFFAPMPMSRRLRGVPAEIELFMRKCRR